MSTLATQYTERFNVALKPLAAALDDFLSKLFVDLPFVSKVAVRAKSIDSFLEKAQRKEDGAVKYSEPLNQIQDQLGGLVVTRFTSEVEDVAEIVEKYFSRIEKQAIEPDSEYEFGYVGRHYVLFLPTEVVATGPKDSEIEFFELQIKTLFQYAWSETNHVIGYKRLSSLSTEQRRLSAFVAAQAWGADRAVEELRRQVDEVSKNGGESA